GVGLGLGLGRVTHWDHGAAIYALIYRGRLEQDGQNTKNRKQFFYYSFCDEEYDEE
ncbi:hypothetical protein ACJX0J_009397, partial [Zea mays]